MKKNFAKVLSVFLAVLMLMTAVPMTSFAATSGTCGTNLTWVLDSTGTLTISGTGYMSTYDEYDDEYAPWYSERSSIKKLVIESGVKSIGNDAFYGLRNLTDVSIADSVSTIYSGAFSSCTALSSITIPDSVVSLSAAFTACTSLKKVNIGSGVVSVSTGLFDGCSALEEINVSADNPTLFSLNGILCGYGGVIKYPEAKTDTVLTLPSNITVIYSSAFVDCKYLTTVVMNGVTEICQFAFENCSALTTLYVGKLTKVNSRGSYFYPSVYNCPNLTDVYMKGSVKDWVNVDLTNAVKNPFSGATIHFEEEYTTKFQKNDIIMFGSYPQTEVTDEALIAQLNEQKESWTYVEDSYKNIQYAEIEYNNNKYRAVLDENNENAVSWFIYEPIFWRIVDPYNGLIMSMSVLEIRAFNEGEERIVSFEDSTIKKWLNEDFYTQAFSENLRSEILTTDVRDWAWNDRYEQLYSSGSSTQTIFIPNHGELQHPFYGNTSVYLSSDYAENWRSSDVYGDRIWTRTVFTYPTTTTTTGGSVNYNSYPRANRGIRPAMYVNLDNISSCTHYFKETVIAPSCTADGYTLYKCTCGYSYTTDPVPAIDHSYTATVTKKATHTETGIMKYTCRCGDTYTEEIAKLTKHTYTKVYTWPTCTEPGYATFTCECGDSYIDEHMEPDGHSYSSYISLSPTHTREGERYYFCHNCDSTYTEVIEKLTEHTYNKNVTAPTCTAQGYTTYTCACGDSYVADYTNATGHSYNAVVTAPTCTKQGYTTYTCACSDSYVTDYVPADGHKYQSYVYQAATHTSTGIMMYDCNNCTSYYTTTIPKTEAHTYNTQVTAPTCTAQGYTTYTCACGDTYVADYVNANGHSHKGSVTTAATHLKEGVMTYNCICGDSYTEVIAKLTAHTYSTQVTAPTCTAQGYTTYTCACGDTYVADYVKANGHSHTGAVTTAATHLKEGVMTYTCHCGDTYTEVIAKLTKHTYKAKVTTEATHLVEGVKTYTCECGASYTEAIPTTDEHTYQKVTTDKATCTQNGTRLYFCECGSEYTETIYATGHKDANSDAFCDSCGTAVCSHMCHQTGFMGFIWKIVQIFWKLFKMNPICECGLAHY